MAAGSTSESSARLRSWDVSGHGRHPAVALVGQDEEGLRRMSQVLEEENVKVLLDASAAGDLEMRLDGRLPHVVVVWARAAREARQCLGTLRRRLPAAATVLVIPTDRPDAKADRLVRMALDARAEGVVYASQIATLLASTVRAVHAGQLVMPSREYRRVKPVALSLRERQVLRLAVEGATNDAIARSLFISLSTVKSHLTSAFAKLSVSSRREAAAMLLDPDDPTGRLMFGRPATLLPPPSLQGER